MALLLASCSKDDNSQYANMTADEADVYTVGSAVPSYAILDNDKKLVFTNQPTVSWMSKADTTYRALIYYNKVEETSSTVSTELVGATRVLTLQPASPEKASKWKDQRDPLKFVSGWRTSRYLNLNLSVLTGNASDMTQSFGVVEDSIKSLSPSGEQKGGLTHYLHLCHNQNSVPMAFSQVVYTSIPLTNIPSTDTIVLNIPTYDGEITKQY